MCCGPIRGNRFRDPEFLRLVQPGVGVPATGGARQLGAHTHTLTPLPPPPSSPPSHHPACSPIGPDAAAFSRAVVETRRSPALRALGGGFGAAIALARGGWSPCVGLASGWRSSVTRAGSVRGVQGRVDEEIPLLFPHGPGARTDFGRMWRTHMVIAIDADSRTRLLKVSPPLLPGRCTLAGASGSRVRSASPAPAAHATRAGVGTPQPSRLGHEFTTHTRCRSTLSTEVRWALRVLLCACDR